MQIWHYPRRPTTVEFNVDVYIDVYVDVYIIHTDEWAAYNGLTAACYTHSSVNHSLQFVHTNTQEGLWAHVKRSVVGSTNLELALVDFMFQRQRNATGGVNQRNLALNFQFK